MVLLQGSGAIFDPRAGTVQRAKRALPFSVLAVPHRSRGLWTIFRSQAPEHPPNPDLFDRLSAAPRAVSGAGSKAGSTSARIEGAGLKVPGSKVPDTFNVRHGASKSAGSEGAGSSICASVPFPSTVRSSRAPSICATSSRQSDSPRPVPAPGSLVVKSSSGSPCSSAPGRPGPSSSTSIPRPVLDRRPAHLHLTHRGALHRGHGLTRVHHQVDQHLRQPQRAHLDLQRAPDDRQDRPPLKPRSDQARHLLHHRGDVTALGRRVGPELNREAA